MVYRTASVVFGVFFAITGFICLLVAISTTYWLDIRVDENKIGGNINQLAYLPRHRGLFMECFSDLTQTNRDCKYEVFIMKYLAVLCPINSGVVVRV